LALNSIQLLSIILEEVNGGKLPMPTYEYHCRKCNYDFEKFMQVSNYAKEIECPVCGEKASLKITGGNGLIFKGSGFYITDYARKKSTSNSNNKGHSNGKLEKKEKPKSKGGESTNK